MSRETQYRRAEMPDPIPESSGRNLRGYGVGASNDTARRGNFCHRTDMMIEAVVERENMHRAYKRVVDNKGAAEWTSSCTEEQSLSPLGSLAEATRKAVGVAGWKTT